MLPALLALPGCGDSPGSQAVHAFDQVHLVNASGTQQPTGVSGLRLRPDGALQALVESGRCVAPSRLDIAETDRAVTLSAYVTTTSDGPCTEQIVPVFVTVHLASPWGRRAVRDGQDGETVRVADCVKRPDDPLCSPAVGTDS